jgi:hypothetical protein
MVHKYTVHRIQIYSFSISVGKAVCEGRHCISYNRTTFYGNACTLPYRCVKGTVTRDFRPVVFTTNQPFIVPEFTP